MLAIVAFMPIALTLVLMMVFNWKAKNCLLLSWLFTAVLGYFLWDIDVSSLVASSFYGVLSSIDVIIIITGAVLLMNTLKASGATAAINFGLALVQMLSFTPEGSNSMMRTMALGLSRVGKAAYVFLSPFIGVLGAFASGSATVSMTLFTNLQCDTASALAVAPGFAVSMQCVGAAIGNMVCINNAVAASATIGVGGREGKLIQLNVLPMVIYTLTTVAIFMVVIFVLGIQP